MAHFELACGRCSIAIQHRTVDELWYVLAGSAELWRKQGNREEIVTLTPGMSFSIPQGTRFQLRSTGSLAFAAIGVTMPPWSGPEEAVKVEGPWDAAHGRAAADDSTGTPQA
jgi:mannose-6-phosphate isomerase-like protein (cupin superfamily)